MHKVKPDAGGQCVGLRDNVCLKTEPFIVKPIRRRDSQKTEDLYTEVNRKVEGKDNSIVRTVRMYKYLRNARD